MDKDRIAGSAQDFAGKVEGTVGDIAGDAKTQAAGRVREATGTAQNLYGQAPRMQRAKLRMPLSATPKTLMRTAAILSVTARKRLRRKCRTTRLVRC